MKVLVITLPHFFSNEAKAIECLFDAGLEILHLRKPKATLEEVEKLILQIPEKYRSQIVTHEHFSLAERYRLMGIHLNGRNPQVPSSYQGQVSCSCHSLQEVSERKKTCQYVFLSPIYNSISKQGYQSAFTREQLIQAVQQGIIDKQVMALGGINKVHLQDVKAIGFGGAVVLGDVWDHLQKDFIPHFLQLKQAAL